MNTWILMVLIVGSLTIATVSMSLIIKKYNTPEPITAIYVIYLALSQILAMKLVDFGFVIAPAAVIIFPFIFQLTDTVNEHFGTKATYRMIVIGFITQVLMVFFITIGNYLPASDTWWFDYFGGDITWNALFGQQLGIIVGSWVAFIMSNFFDTWFYGLIKKLTKGKYLWLRSILTDIPSLSIDSVIFVTIAFGLFGGLWAIVLPTIFGQLVTKWVLGVIDTPFIYLDRWIVNFERKPK